MYFVALLGKVERFGFDEMPRWITWALRVGSGDDDGAHGGLLPSYRAARQGSIENDLQVRMFITMVRFA